MKFLLFFTLFVSAGVAWWCFRTDIAAWAGDRKRFLAFTLILCSLALAAGFVLSHVNFSLI